MSGGIRSWLLLRFLSSAVAGSALALGVGPSAASAQCIGPELALSSSTVAGGDTLTITGTAFGTDCYDSGRPPRGEGVLGVPQHGLQLLLVQGVEEIVVAEGNADASYGFTVAIVVPADLEPGSAVLSIRTAQDFAAPVPQDLTVTTGAPAPGEGGAPATPVRFGPAEAVDRVDRPASPTDDAARSPLDGWNPLPLVAVSVTVAVVAAAAFVVRHRRASATARP